MKNKVKNNTIELKPDWQQEFEELKPGWQQCFELAKELVRDSIPKDRGREAVIEMLGYGQRLDKLIREPESCPFKDCGSRNIMRSLDGWECHDCGRLASDYREEVTDE